MAGTPSVIVLWAFVAPAAFPAAGGLAINTNGIFTTSPANSWLEENGPPITTSTLEQMGRATEQEWQTMQQLAKGLNLRQQ